jgi:hypothetical protein
MAANRPHFHLWKPAATGRALFRLARGFHSRQAASQYAKRHYPEHRCMVLACERPECRPALD